MRIFNKYAYMGAIALVGAVGFTACSSDDDLTAQDPVTGEVVKTQFAISIPGATQTRMGQDIVQSTGNPFRGMTNIRLVPFDLESTPTGTSNPLTESETMRYNAIVLGDIGNADLKSNSNAKLYTDIDIPLGTNAFLFYAEALESSDNSDATNGALVPSFASTGLPVGASISSVSFSLKEILGTNDYLATEAQNKLLRILNGLANDVTGDEDKNWADATGDLKIYRDNFIKLKAGSANNILLAVQDLYNAMQSSRVTDESNLKSAISNKIKENFSVDGVAEPYTLSYKSPNNDDVKTYPNNYNLPDGAVQVNWNVDRFEYITNVDYDATSSNIFNVASLDKYVFPSSLYYWLNTNIKTSNTSQSSLYDGNNTWDAILNSYNNGYEVTASTQSIALENKINYAVGRLDVYAKFASGEIMDNATPSKAVTIPTDGFTLTGILVGGQKAVMWNFDTNSAADEYTIYDSKVPVSTGVTRTDGLKNSTLLLETVKSTSDKVNIALEFKNNGTEAFEGADGIIPIGGKFYLVGQLVPTADNQKVFEKDHVTKANVTISSLKNAYNCIPDLRSPKLELGLSVDLEWQTGLSYDVTIQ